MGLSSSLHAGISGLERQQASLNVIGNNIANVSTNGYKSQRVLFNDILYNTTKSGTAPNGTSAGTNPSQVGGGVDISAIDTNFNQGEIATTGIASDLAVEGNGFFILSDGNEQVYTRDGAFNLSQSRTLVNGGTGMAVQGWVQTRDNAGNSTINTGGATTDVVIPVGDNRVAKSTTNFVMNGNLNNAGTTATTGTILNSQRFFSAKSGDVEVTSGAIDLANVYIKDPAGGVDNVRLYKGSGSASNGDTNVLADGDQITVQISKGGRPLEAIFVYGDGDLVNNTTGQRAPDDVPDFSLESYDGKTMDDFLNWFDQAFGLHAVETQGASPDFNAAHGSDGDNPNDLVDMGLDSTTPFKDETDANGFEFVVASIGAAANGTVPKVGYKGGEKEFNVVAGSGSDVGVGSSYIDVDEDGAYNKAKDIALDGTVGYVVNSAGSVTKGYQSTSPQPLIVRGFHNADGTLANTNMAFIDADSSQKFNADTDILIKDTTVAFMVAPATAVPAFTYSTTAGTLSTTDAGGANVAVGNFFIHNASEFYVTGVASATVGAVTTYTLTLDKSFATANAASAVANTTLTFGGANLAAGGLGYTASTTTAAGSTVATTLNLPKGTKQDNKFQGVSIADVMTDNEAGNAGSTFTQGDAKIRIATGVDTVKYAYVDSNGDGALSEAVFDVKHDGTNLYVDLDNSGTANATTELVGVSTVTTLSAYTDNDKVFTDATGNVYRKVPKIYDTTETKVYLDTGNKGVYDEQRLSLENIGHGVTGIDGSNVWVITGTTTVVSQNSNAVEATSAAIDTSSTATLDRPNSTVINELSSGSGRIQIRGNIGTVNELSDISFISGVDKVERNVFAASSLADSTGASYSKVSSASGESVAQNIVVYDSLGKSHDVNMTFVLEAKDNDKATWRWYAETADVSRKNGIFPVGDPRGAAPSMNVGSGTVAFDNFGRFLTASGATANSEALVSIPLEGQDTDSALNIKPDFSILTSFASSVGSQVDVREQDGYAQGVMDRYTVNQDGSVTGIYTNGMTEVVAQIALAAFANPDGLTRAGGNLFMIGSNSGNAMVGAAITGERGAIRGEALEQSNVDITDEFTNMISTQRAYQASARVVTKSDELLQELMQIIR